MREENTIRYHVLTLMIVGGALLFAFVLYLIIALVYWLLTNPAVLVYTFLGLFTVECYWLLFAFLKRRLGVRRRGTAKPVSAGQG